MNGLSRKVLATLLIPACLMCAGCTDALTEADPKTTDASSVAKTEKSVADCANYGGPDNVGECELKLHDGRRVTCAILLGYKQGGLSCDWEHAAKTDGGTK